MTNFQLVITFQGTTLCPPASHLQDQITHRCKHRKSYRTTFYKCRATHPENLHLNSKSSGETSIWLTFNQTRQQMFYTSYLLVFTTSKARISLVNGHSVWKWQNFNSRSAPSSSKPVIFHLEWCHVFQQTSKANLNIPSVSLVYKKEISGQFSLEIVLSQYNSYMMPRIQFKNLKYILSPNAIKLTTYDLAK